MGQVAEELVKEMQKGEDGEISCSTVVVNMESWVHMGRSCHLACRAGVCRHNPRVTSRTPWW